LADSVFEKLDIAEEYFVIFVASAVGLHSAVAEAVHSTTLVLCCYETYLARSAQLFRLLRVRMNFSGSRIFYE